MGLAYFNEGPFTGLAGEALEAYRRVKLSSGEWVYADMADEGLAITGPLPVADGDQVTLYPCNSGGIVPVTGDGAISSGAVIYGANDGKVTSYAGPARAVGVMLSAISADGGIAAAMLGVYHADQFTPNTDVYIYYEDFFSGVIEDGGKFSETADKAEWLKTSIDGDSDAGDVCIVQDDGPGGILSLGCNDKALDSEELQLNGESFKLATGKPVWFESKFAIQDVTVGNVFIGLAITDTTVSTGTTGVMRCTDYVGFHNIHTGNVLAVCCQNSTAATPVTTGVLTDCAAVTNFAATGKRFAFYWDGAGNLSYFLDGTYVGVFVDDGSATIIPDDEALTPTIVISNSATSTEVVWVDYIYIVAAR